MRQITRSAKQRWRQDERRACYRSPNRQLAEKVAARQAPGGRALLRGSTTLYPSALPHPGAGEDVVRSDPSPDDVGLLCVNRGPMLERGAPVVGPRHLEHSLSALDSLDPEVGRLNGRISAQRHTRSMECGSAGVRDQQQQDLPDHAGAATGFSVRPITAGTVCRRAVFILDMVVVYDIMTA